MGLDWQDRIFWGRFRRQKPALDTAGDRTSFLDLIFSFLQTPLVLQFHGSLDCSRSTSNADSGRDALEQMIITGIHSIDDFSGVLSCHSLACYCYLASRLASDIKANIPCMQLTILSQCDYVLFFFFLFFSCFFDPKYLGTYVKPTKPAPPPDQTETHHNGPSAVPPAFTCALKLNPLEWAGMGHFFFLPFFYFFFSRLGTLYL